MAGPMVAVKTQVAGINLDVGRLLNMGSDVILEFIVSDTSEITKWRTVLSMTKSWNRIDELDSSNDKTGSPAIFKVADLEGTVSTVIRLQDLHVRVEGKLYSVTSVPPVPSHRAQVYTLTCKTRTLRGQFDTTQ